MKLIDLKNKKANIDAYVGLQNKNIRIVEDPYNSESELYKGISVLIEHDNGDFSHCNPQLFTGLDFY